MLGERFSYASFVSSAQGPGASPFRDTQAAQLEALTSALAQEIERRLRGSSQPQREMQSVVEELRRLGHEVYSFDASDDWETFTTWGPSAEKLEWDLSITATYSAPQSVGVAFRRR